MSRSNPTEGAKNPATRWFEWGGGADDGSVRYYNKETQQKVKVDLPFTFLLLDVLATVKGWHDPSESGIYANEVKDTRQEALVVRAFKGGELASGIYSQIKDRVGAVGGHFSASLYLAYKDGDSLKIGNLQLKGAALSAWMDFKKANGGKCFSDAVKIIGSEQMKKGGTTFRVPKFALQEVSEATNKQALALDAELQDFLADYLKRPKAEAAKPGHSIDDAPPFAPEEHAPVFEEDSIPF